MSEFDKKELFKRLVERDGLEVFDFDKDTGLKTGDKVIYTNEFGVEFGPLEILGFSYSSYLYQKYHQNYIYLNTSSYWFPVKASEIRLHTQ